MSSQEVEITGYDKFEYDKLFTEVCPLTREGVLHLIHEKSISLIILESLRSMILIEEKLEFNAQILYTYSSTVFDLKLKEIIENQFDDLDYILILAADKGLIYVVKYLQSKGYKICMPLGDEPELLKLLQQSNITLQCENRYNAQQKLNL